MSTYVASPDAAVSPLAGAPGGRGPRLAPIARLRGLGLRLFAFIFRRQMGKTMSAIGVIYARMPGLLFPQAMMIRLGQKGLSLDPTLVDMVQIRVSLAHGCTFCTDLHHAMALRSGRNRDKLRAALDLAAPDAQARLSPVERAALAFGDEMARGGVPADGTFATARTLLGERGVVELVWLCSFTGYLNSMARALHLQSDGLCALAASREGHADDLPTSPETK
jgi:AhpD family alkylhydroperoxidase